jgi:hypothetical protein
MWFRWIRKQYDEKGPGAEKKVKAVWVKAESLENRQFCLI